MVVEIRCSAWLRLGAKTPAPAKHKSSPDREGGGPPDCHVLAACHFVVNSMRCWPSLQRDDSLSRPARIRFWRRVAV
jgi:hypothetical protein